MIRLCIIIAGLVGTSLTHLGKNVMVFWILGSDLSFTIMLPQLICVLFTDVSNGYGSIAGYLVGVTMRVLCGEPLFGLPAALQFPGYTLEDGVYIQQVPVKTICMLASLVSILVFSFLTKLLFKKGFLPERWDVFQVKPIPASDLQVGNADETDDKSPSEPMLNMIGFGDCS